MITCDYKLLVVTYYEMTNLWCVQVGGFRECFTSLSQAKTYIDGLYADQDALSLEDAALRQKLP